MRPVQSGHHEESSGKTQAGKIARESRVESQDKDLIEILPITVLVLYIEACRMPRNAKFDLANTTYIRAEALSLLQLVQLLHR